MNINCNYCRICLKTVENLRVINKYVCQQFFEVSQIELKLVGNYSKNICDNCLEELEKNYLYRKFLIGNQEKLRNLIDGILCDRDCEEGSQETDDPGILRTNEEKTEALDSSRENEKVEGKPCDNKQKMLENSSETLIDLKKESVEIIEEIKENFVNSNLVSDEPVKVSSPISSQELQKAAHCVSPTPNIFSDTDDTNTPEPTRKSLSRKRLKDPLKCPSCEKIFYYKSYLSFHYKDVHVQQNEICPICGKLFKNSRRLNSHLVTHSKSKKFQCEICQKQFNFSGDYTRHLRIHNNVRPYQCDQCDQSFKQSYALTLHKQNKHDLIKFKCEICDTEFSCKPTLKKHLMKCVSGNLRARKSSNFQYGERIKYKCLVEDCDKNYAMKKYLKTHMMRDHQMNVEKFETTCLECKKVFDNIGDYSVHVKIHSCNFVCTLCKLRFKTEEKLKKHEEKFHQTEENRPFKCVDCQATFKRNEHLRAHALYKHSEKRPFSCPECLLSFRQRGEYNIHMRIHTGLKPFKCNQCGYESKTSSNLRQHMLIIHENDEIYQCKECQLKFKYAFDLNTHKREVHPIS